MTGYFGGYISKKQKIGQFELKKSIGALPLLKRKLEEKVEKKEIKTGSGQLAHVTNRMFTTLESKGILSVATEEFRLASQYKPHDPLAAEFIRTFRERKFHGKYFLERFESLAQKTASVDVRIVLPRSAVNRTTTDEPSLYGFRSLASDWFYLSPWEFCQWVLPERLKAPSYEYNLTVLTSSGREKRLSCADGTVVLEAGVDVILNDYIIGLQSELFPVPEPDNLFTATV